MADRTVIREYTYIGTFPTVAKLREGEGKLAVQPGERVSSEYKLHSRYFKTDRELELLKRKVQPPVQEAPKADGANQGKNAGDEWEEYSFDEMKEMLVEGGLNPPEEITEKEPLVARCVQQHITLTQ